MHRDCRPGVHPPLRRSPGGHLRALIAHLLLVLWSVTAAGPVFAEALARLDIGAGSFSHPFPGAAGRERRIKVWYHRPAAAGVDATLVFVMHGTGRNAESYRRAWVPFADEQGFVLLVPEFSRTGFSRDYNLERLHDADGSTVPRAEWPYLAVERIFDAVKKDNGFTSRRYDIYGHSAGAQFVHRLAFLVPEARYRVAIVANAGWYTMPDFDVQYPYGLAGSGVDAAALRAVLARRIVVLLGDRDTDGNHPDLRRTPPAMAQGMHRLERGQRFFETAMRAAPQPDAFAWTMRIVPGVAHSNGAMAGHAARLIGR